MEEAERGAAVPDAGRGEPAVALGNEERGYVGAGGGKGGDAAPRTPAAPGANGGAIGAPSGLRLGHMLGGGSGFVLGVQRVGGTGMASIAGDPMAAVGGGGASLGHRRRCRAH